MKFLSLFTATLVLFGMIASPAFAQLRGAVDVESSAKGIIDEASMEADALIEVDSKTEVMTTGSDSSIKTDTSMEAEARMDSDTSTTHSAKDDGDITAEMEVKSETRATDYNSSRSNRTTSSVRLNTGITFDVRKSEKEIEGQADVQSAAGVTSNETLEIYARTLVREDNSVDSVEARGDEVVVTSKQRVRLLGFIPVRANARTSVVFEEGSESSVQARVKVKYPWWKFLARAEQKTSDVEAMIQAKVDSTLSARAEIDAQAQAEILSAVEATLEASSQTGASVN